MGPRSRSNIHSAKPSVHIFLQRNASLLPEPNGLTASSVNCEMLKDDLPAREAAVLKRC